MIFPTQERSTITFLMWVSIPAHLTVALSLVTAVPGGISPLKISSRTSNKEKGKRAGENEIRDINTKLDKSKQNKKVCEQHRVPHSFFFSFLQLTFSDFDIEAHATCAWDSVTVRNGGSPGSPLIGQYCGSSNPRTIQSGSNQLVVIFNSDHSVQNGGFYAAWNTQTLGKRNMRF